MCLKLTSNWPQTWSVAEDDVEFLVFLPPPPQGDEKHSPPHSVRAILQLRPCFKFVRKALFCLSCILRPSSMAPPDLLVSISDLSGGHFMTGTQRCRWAEVGDQFSPLGRKMSLACRWPCSARDYLSTHLVVVCNTKSISCLLSLICSQFLNPKFGLVCF